MSTGIAPRIILVALTVLAGCASPGLKIDERATAAGLERIDVQAEFPSLIYMKRAPDRSAGQPLLVFLEGDGIPWRAGIIPSLDPTTHNPVALDLLINSPAPSAYVTRPCYHGLRGRNCTTEQWTSGRYSAAVVESMIVAVREAQRRLGEREIVLIGFSGGGVLAVLIAERLKGVRAVVTLAANLDIDAWTSHHGYLRLSQSLNPSRSQLPHPWTEVHLQGADDKVTPASTTTAYFERFPQAQRKIIAAYDHVCCWVRDWEALSRQLPLAAE